MKRLFRLALIPIVAGLLVATVGPVLADQASDHAAAVATARATLVTAEAARAVAFQGFTDAFNAYETVVQASKDAIAAAPADKVLVVIAEGTANRKVASDAFKVAQDAVTVAIKVAHDARWALRDLLVIAVAPIPANLVSPHDAAVATARATLATAQADLATARQGFSDAFNAYETVAQASKDAIVAAPADRVLIVIAEGKANRKVASDAFKVAQDAVIVASKAASVARWAVSAALVAP